MLRKSFPVQPFRLRLLFFFFFLSRYSTYGCNTYAPKLQENSADPRVISYQRAKKDKKEKQESNSNRRQPSLGAEGNTVPPLVDWERPLSNRLILLFLKRYLPFSHP